jgi:hypothetical protein
MAHIMTVLVILILQLLTLAVGRTEAAATTTTTTTSPSIIISLSNKTRSFSILEKGGYARLVNSSVAFLPNMEIPIKMSDYLYHTSQSIILQLILTRHHE